MNNIPMGETEAEERAAAQAQDVVERKKAEEI